MTKIDNLRPSEQRSRDDLRILLRNSKNTQTVPVGVKVAQPDERIVFYDSSFAQHTWDGDAIADFDSRIDAAQKAVDDAKADLELTRDELDEAKSRIQASGGDFSVYADRISASEQKLAEALKAQEALQKTLSSTSTDVKALSDKTVANANDVQKVSDSLSNVEAVAQQAQDAAVQAQTSANEVSSQAENAADTAQKALDVARAPVTLDRLVVNGDLAAAVVNAMDANVKRLVVTEDALLNNATFLGTTVADQLNVTKRLVARDAIVNGTLDVAQLNVTSAMSAEIVKAMSLESKKLVVSDEAILNKATVLQSLVTPELIAQKINVQTLGAQLITAGALQTDAASNAGVKISNSGIRAWDDNGAQTLTLDGKNNTIVGEFATDRYGQPRVRVFNRYNQTFSMTETLIDMQSSGVAGVTSYDNAIVRLSASGRFGFGISLGGNDSDKRQFAIDPGGGVLLGGNTVVSGSLMAKGITSNGNFKANGNFGINGKVDIGTGMAFGWFTGTSLGANQWMDAELPLNTTMSGNSPKIFTNVKSTNRVPILCSVWGVSATKFNVRIYNLSTSTSTGSITGEWMAVVAND